MRRIGISLYPNHSKLAQIIEYIECAAHYNAARIFSCLLSADLPKDEIVRLFKEVTAQGHKYNMKIFVDVAPRIFTALGISYKDLGFFKEINVDGIRLDESFSGSEEALMTFNNYGLEIELNISSGTRHLDTIFTYKPKAGILCGCHNFYPHRYTGLTWEHFVTTSKGFKKYGLETSAFISAPSAMIGPWYVDEGLCTVEAHRTLPIDVQAKQLWSTELIDNVIIANCFASEAEFAALAKLDPYMLSLKCAIEPCVTALDKKILFEELHFNRGDVSPNVIRSTQSRVKYKGENFPVYNAKPIKRGDILIESSNYEHYAGEMQIALHDMENSGKTNVVGHIDSAEHFLLDAIEPWQKFRLYS